MFSSVENIDEYSILDIHLTFVLYEKLCLCIVLSRINTVLPCFDSVRCFYK